MTQDSITRHVHVPLPPPQAWSAFVHGFADWWPGEHCFCGEPALETVYMDVATGQWGELRRDGTRQDWGAVLLAEPGVRLRLGWQMDATVSPWIPEPNPERASLVDVSFLPEGDGTRVELTHHAFSRQPQAHAEAMRAVMIGLDRWAEWLALYAKAATGAGGGSAEGRA